LLNSVSTGISKLCLDSSLQPLRARGLLVATVSTFFFSFGDVVTSFVWYYLLLFGLAAAPFSVIVWLDNGVTLRFGLSHNVMWVLSFSRSGVNIWPHVSTLCIFFFYWVSVWKNQGGQRHKFILWHVNPLLGNARNTHTANNTAAVFRVHAACPFSMTSHNITGAVFSLCLCSLRMLYDVTQFRGSVFCMVHAGPI
jgi:hypothetical protein